MSAHKRRGVWLKLHLYLGLSAGLIFAVLGLTGSILVFWQALDRWLEPEKVAFQPRCLPADHLSLDSLIAAAKINMPAEGNLTTVLFPQAERPEYRLLYQVASPRYPGEFDRYELYVEPCTAQVKGPRLWDRLDQPAQGPLMAVIMRLHTGLLISKPPQWYGSDLVGTAAVVLLLSIASGLYLWWPKRLKAWHPYTFKRGASVERNLYDLHKLAGVYGVIVLGGLLFTGAAMYSPWHEWLTKAVQWLSPGTATVTSAVSEPIQGSGPIEANTALLLAKKTAPDWQAESLTLPDGPNGVYLITLRSNESVRSRQITLDQYSGKLIGQQGAGLGTAGDIFIDWLFPLHTGKAFGLTGRIIVLLAGLLPITLFITGTMRWLQKRLATTKRINRN